ncbi:MAG: Gfo/Idh/MocA family oxidoreductase, partial [Pseudomonadota bacterium]
MKYGLIGCGMMGLEHIENIALLDGADVTAVFDPVDELAQHAARAAGGAQVCTSLRQLVETVEALVIVSPNYVHVDQLMEIATIQHIPILCESRVRHVGDAIAFIVADSVALARDAAEMIDVD